MRAYDLLKTKVGLSPAKILAASKATLVEVTKVGGAIAASQRAERLQQSARLVVEEWDGDLRAVLELPFAEAKRALTRFPMLGDPGAEKLLLIARRHRGLVLESNGLRVLVRMGYGREGKSYRATYRSVQAAIENELSHDYQWLLRAHHLLRRHGRELCRRKPQVSSGKV